jgi:hypothetical protein
VIEKATAIMITVTMANPTVCRRSTGVPRRQRTISDARAISQPRPITVDQKYHSYKSLTVGKLYSFFSVAITTSAAETPSRAFQSLPGRGPSG